MCRPMTLANWYRKWNYCESVELKRNALQGFAAHESRYLEVNKNIALDESPTGFHYKLPSRLIKASNYLLDSRYKNNFDYDLIVFWSMSNSSFVETCLEAKCTTRFNIICCSTMTSLNVFFIEAQQHKGRRQRNRLTASCPVFIFLRSLDVQNEIT